MNKELTLLEAYNELVSILEYYENKAKRNYQTVRGFEELPQLKNIIETALKRLELQDSIKERVEQLPSPEIIVNGDGSYQIEGCNNLVIVDKDIYDKQLKVLEIIQEKKMLKDAVLECSTDEYNEYARAIGLPEITDKEMKIIEMFFI